MGTQFMELLRGKDAYRIRMNAECERYTLRGRVTDIGGGGARASYHRFFKKDDNIVVESLDLDGKAAKTGGHAIDLEREPLPYVDASRDTLLCFNVLEHIHRYPELLKEMRRVLAPDGRLYGATPFLVGYHPDPHDYWRFTREALETIFAEAGFRRIDIRPFGGGPLLAAYSQWEWILPRFIRWLSYFHARMLDALLLWWKPELRQRFALGYFFVFEPRS